MGIDDLIKQMQEDERRDKATTVNKLTPIEFARLHGMTPQKVYQHLRKHRGHESCDKHLALVPCDCGKMVLDVKAAKEYFGIKEEPVGYIDAHEDAEEQIPEEDGVEVEQEEDGDVPGTDEDPDGIDSMDEQYDKPSQRDDDTERYDSPWR